MMFLVIILMVMMRRILTWCSFHRFHLALHQVVGDLLDDDGDDDLDDVLDLDLDYDDDNDLVDDQ